jgi:hypothetical protein
MTGVAPLPVPPPTPEVKNTKSLPFNMALMADQLSLAAFCPVVTLVVRRDAFESFKNECADKE